MTTRHFFMSSVKPRTKSSFRLNEKVPYRQPRMCVCICMYVCVCVYVCMYVYRCMHMCICMCMYVVCKYVCVCMCVYVCGFERPTRMRPQVNLNTHIHTYI